MEEFREALRDNGEYTLMELNIIPNSKENSIAGYDRWRKRIILKVAAPPLDNRANREIVSFLSRIFHISSRDVSIVVGEKNSRKTVEIKLGIEEVLKVLSSNYEPD